MRIIGGEHGGRRIAAPKGKATRPMLDRIREAVFSALAPRLADAFVLDLFAGSGCLGLEALSRGARCARFVERDARTAALVRDNAVQLRLEERAEVVVADALAPRAWGEEPADLVFLDPPYPLVEDPRTRPKVLAALESLFSGHLAADAVVVFHVPRGLLDESAFPAGSQVRERVYGSNSLWFLTAADEEDACEG